MCRVRQTKTEAENIYYMVTGEVKIMPVAKLKCKCGCKKYQFREKVVKTPFGNFYNKEHAIKHAQDKFKRDKLRRLAKAKQSVVKKEKAFRVDLRARKEKLKSASDWNKEAQAAVNKYIRLRDRNKPCVSCGSSPSDNNLITGSRFDAGHYRSRGSASHLRFNLLNIHKQCVKCNRFNSGNAVDYRIELIRRIGIDNVNKLESDNEPRKFTIEYLERIKRIFNKRARFYEKR